MKYAIAALLLASPAAAQQQCGTVEQAYKLLTETYHEQRIMTGAAAGGAVAEVWASEEGTWTFLIIQGELACMIASGENVVLLPPPPNV